MSVQLYMGRGTLPEFDTEGNLTRRSTDMPQGVVAVFEAEETDNTAANSIIEYPHKYDSIENIYFHSSLRYLHEIITFKTTIDIAAATKEANPYYSTFSRDKGVGIYRTSTLSIPVPNMEAQQGDNIYIYHKAVRYYDMEYTSGTGTYPLLELQSQLAEQKWQKDNLTIKNNKSYIEIKLMSATTGQLDFLVNEIHNEAYFTKAEIDVHIKVIGSRDA